VLVLLLFHAWVAEDVDELFGLLSELFGESDASDSVSVNGDGEEMRDLWMSNYAGELYTILAGMELVLRVTGPGPSSSLTLRDLSRLQLAAVKQVATDLPGVVERRMALGGPQYASTEALMADVHLELEAK
jgi:hypothetical protein